MSKRTSPVQYCAFSLHDYIYKLTISQKGSSVSQNTHMRLIVNASVNKKEVDVVQLELRRTNSTPILVHLDTNKLNRNI